MYDYLLVNDIHLSDQPPSSCTGSYQDDLFDLLECTRQLAKKRKSKAVILAGDVIHSKTPSRTSHRTVIRLVDHLRQYPCPVLIVPGNHDMQHDRLDSLDETQPLGVVFASGAAHMLVGWSAVTAGLIDDPVYGVPWQIRWQDDVVASALADWRDGFAGSKPGLVVAHAPLYPPGLELTYEFYPAGNWAQAMDGHGTVHYGHVHEAHGVYTVDGVVFSNPGALSRGSRHEHQLSRQIAIAGWSPKTGKVTHYGLPHKPAAQVFRLAEVAQASATQLSLDSFIHAVGATRIEITSIEAVIAAIQAMDHVEQPVRDTAVELLQGVG